MSITIQNVTRRFGSYTALQDINLTVEKGELVSLLGPSGSGKTTLLRIIAGLERSDAGRILLHGSDATSVPVRHRKVGFVFQSYALFRHMTVTKNIAFGLSVLPRSERPSRTEIAAKVKRLLEFMQLDGLGGRYPNQLSGGQRQRVALARALAIDPKVLLLDEPFGALDAKVRKELRKWLRNLHEELQITTVFVTHDQDEALELADRVVLMNQARIEQVGSPKEIYDHPATPFVHEFLGKSNALKGSASGDRIALGDLTLPREQGSSAGEVVAYVRPHNVHLSRIRNGVPAFEVEIRHVYDAGPVARIDLERVDTGEALEAELSRQRLDELGLNAGERAFASIHDARVYPVEAGA